MLVIWITFLWSYCHNISLNPNNWRKKTGPDVNKRLEVFKLPNSLNDHKSDAVYWRSLGSIYIIAYYLKWGKTSWTDYRLDAEYLIIFLTLFCFFGSLGLKCHVSLEYLDRQGGGTNGRIRVIRGGVPKKRKKTNEKTKQKCRSNIFELSYVHVNVYDKTLKR